MNPSNSQRSKAATKLAHAAIYLIRTRKYGTIERALAILGEAELKTRNRFTEPITYEYFGFDSLLWDGSGVPLYSKDTIETR